MRDRTLSVYDDEIGITNISSLSLRRMVDNMDENIQRKMESSSISEFFLSAIPMLTNGLEKETHVATCLKLGRKNLEERLEGKTDLSDFQWQKTKPICFSFNRNFHKVPAKPSFLYKQRFLGLLESENMQQKFFPEWKETERVLIERRDSLLVENESLQRQISQIEQQKIIQRASK